MKFVDLKYYIDLCIGENLNISCIYLNFNDFTSIAKSDNLYTIYINNIIIHKLDCHLQNNNAIFYFKEQDSTYCFLVLTEEERIIKKLLE